MPLSDLTMSVLGQGRVREPLDGLGGIELEQAQDRAGQREADRGMLGQLEATLADRDQQAKLVANAYRRAGLSTLARELEQSNRQSAFNAARRGITGGSADISARAGNVENAQRGAADVEAQAGNLYNQQMLGDLGQVFQAQQQVMGGNPFATMMQNLEIGRQNDLTQMMLGEYDVSANQRAIDQGYGMGVGQVWGGAASGLGRALGGYWRGNA